MAVILLKVSSALNNSSANAIFSHNAIIHLVFNVLRGFYNFINNLSPLVQHYFHLTVFKAILQSLI